jgi:predicted ATPase
MNIIYAMLTRLKISGFKNLKDVDVQFGPFTCIAGLNGVGKSNLFDAIHFLSLLSNRSLMEAAAFVRDDAGRSDSVQNLFSYSALGQTELIRLEAEMIIPKTALDDLNQQANATTTFVKYELHLRWAGDSSDGLGPIRIEREVLQHLLSKEHNKHLSFPHDKKKWRDEVVKMGRRTVPYISTSQSNDGVVINRHQDGGSKGKPQPIFAHSLPRTILSRANADESPTALCARREMESWRMLQLEPSSLRQPDSFNSPTCLSPNGGHLPATISRIIEDSSEDNGVEIQQITNRLRELVPDVRRMRIEKNERLERLTLYVKLADGSEHAARSLSDGTLRFLALVVLEADPTFTGVLCFEEPENGIHPQRISTIIELLQDIATDPDEVADITNPLRQVIINTHSPEVVKIIPDSSLLIARSVVISVKNTYETQVRFGFLSDTWRSSGLDQTRDILNIANVSVYLAPPQSDEDSDARRVIDRPDAQEHLLLTYDNE